MSKHSKNDISTVHPALKIALDRVRRCRDSYEGADAVKASNSLINNAVLSTDEEYLPKLDGQDKKQYQSYKNRAVFYAAMSRTVIALAGAIDRKPVQVDGAGAIETFLKDVTGTGVSFEEFMTDIEREILVSGRVIVCIDRKNSSDNRPYLVWYKNEDCINWFSEEYTSFNERLTGMVFKEAYYTSDPDNAYAQIQATRYREYILEKGKATVNLWTTDSTKKAEIVNITGENTSKVEYTITETYTLTNRGKDLGFIPCVPIVASGSSFQIPKPPLLDLVDINYAHYRNSADYEHGLHWTALPTPYFTGLDTKSKIVVGSGSAIIMNEPGSKAGFLEFKGTGLATIDKAMKSKEDMMSALGARMLASRADQSTSAEVTRINYSGETAALCNIAKSISRGATRLLRMVSEWEHNKDYAKIEAFLNEDYVDSKLAGSDITALMGAHQGGVMSLESLIWNLSQGERLPQGRTVDDEIALIEADQDREADEAIYYEGEDVGFSGNKFSSGQGTASSKEAPTDDDGDKE